MTINEALVTSDVASAALEAIQEKLLSYGLHLTEWDWCDAENDLSRLVRDIQVMEEV